MVQAAYRLYLMLRSTLTSSQLTNTNKAIWSDPLMALYKIAEQKALQGKTDYNLYTLHNKIKDYDKDLYELLKWRASEKKNTKQLKQLRIVYYNIVYDKKVLNRKYQPCLIRINLTNIYHHYKKIIQELELLIQS